MNKKYLWLSGFAVWLVLCFAAPVISQAETYTYDTAGRLTGVTYDDGSSITYTYDNAGNLTNQQQQIVDGDGDGVSDADDLCPGTPFGEAVDANGCSGTQLDSDGDGVNDALDQCHGFDDNADADGDGIADGCDVCPGFDDTVDTDSDGAPDGCDSDDDDDGIDDVLDTQSLVFSSDFLDSRSDGSGVTGQIVDRAGHNVTVNPGSGVITVSVDNSGGLNPAKFIVLGVEMDVLPGTTIELSSGSLAIKIITGSATVKFTDGGGNIVTIVLVTNDNVTIDTTAFTIENNGSGTLTVSVDGEEINIVPGETINLSVNTLLITDLSARAKCGRSGCKIQLTWSHVGAVSYNVYRSDAGEDYEHIGDTTSTYSTYQDALVDNGTEYCYIVRGVDAQGNVSADSAEACATPTERIIRRR